MAVYYKEQANKGSNHCMHFSQQNDAEVSDSCCLTCSRTLGTRSLNFTVNPSFCVLDTAGQNPEESMAGHKIKSLKSQIQSFP
jgi:hypothetical protein